MGEIEPPKEPDPFLETTPAIEVDAQEAPDEVEPVDIHRLTVVEQVYHQIAGEQPTSVNSQFSRVLASDEQPYVRRCKATEDWQPIDIGWVEDVGMLVIVNNEGTFRHRIPTDEQRAEVAKRVLDVGVETATGICRILRVWKIPPGESGRGQPIYPKQLRIRSQYGTVLFTIYVFPA